MVIGNDQKNNVENFWEILERIIGKISSIIGIGVILIQPQPYADMQKQRYINAQLQ